MSSDQRDLWESAGGNVPVHWKFSTVAELLESPKSISVGVMYPGPDTPGGVPLVRVSDVKAGRVICQPEFCVSNEVDEEYKRTRLNGSELIITLVGNPGDCVIVTEDMVGWNAARALAVLRLKDPELRSWLRYVLLSEPAKHLIDSRLNTTVQKTLNLKDVKELSVPIAPKKEREHIAGMVAVIESKLLLNVQINQTLEQIAQAIFKSWFIDFEPVKAKQHIRTLGGNDEQTERAAQAVIAGVANLDVITAATDHYALDQQLTKALAEKLADKTEEQRAQLVITTGRFPKQLVESGLGLIPEGWVPTTLSKMIKLIGGGTPKKSVSRYWGGDIPWFSVKDSPGDGQVFVLDTDLKITDTGLSESSTRLLDEGTTIISARGTVGRLALVGVPMAMNQSCYGVTGAYGIPPIFNYFNLRRAVDVLKQNTHGAVFDTITRATFETVDQVIPQKEVIRCFEATVESLMFQVKSNGLQSHNLARLRDVLLPRLLSGESTCIEAISVEEAVS